MRHGEGRGGSSPMGGAAQQRGKSPDAAIMPDPNLNSRHRYVQCFWAAPGLPQVKGMFIPLPQTKLLLPSNLHGRQDRLAGLSATAQVRIGMPAE